MACGVPAVPGDGARGRGEHATVVGLAVAGRRQHGVRLAGFESGGGARSFNLSGVSGGPVFWSTADHFGLVGFVYEGDQTGPADDMIQRPRVRFFVETCDYHEFSRWTEELRTARAGRVMPVRRIA